MTNVGTNLQVYIYTHTKKKKKSKYKQLRAWNNAKKKSRFIISSLFPCPFFVSSISSGTAPSSCLFLVGFIVAVLVLSASIFIYVCLNRFESKSFEGRMRRKCWFFSRWSSLLTSLFDLQGEEEAEKINAYWFWELCFEFLFYLEMWTFSFWIKSIFFFRIGLLQQV